MFASWSASHPQSRGGSCGRAPTSASKAMRIQIYQGQMIDGTGDPRRIEDAWQSMNSPEKIDTSTRFCDLKDAGAEGATCVYGQFAWTAG
ncbi:hypothetical protein N7468_001319 [Penicillium chermesinum]|uniref:Uncharacterized protein n=1 Tax=Penicillium chermesinum TaxID=63820 RepID=A0A9W9TWF9_9EURO|nr:uncharacterized protein N7468_001319 [Penicillium chermesinum]KAJ5246336.1 hypothetical protein N7468_001319 [Penicillium chermesinum]